MSTFSGRAVATMLMVAAVSAIAPMPKVSASSGSVLRSVTAQSYSCSFGTGVAFDGLHLLISCTGDNTISAISPANGARLGVYRISGMDSIGALSWDPKRNQLWACGGGSPSSPDDGVYLVDLASSTASFEFYSDGCLEGLAYDLSDDSLYTSAASSSSVEHFATNGSYLSSRYNALPCGSSGLAIQYATLYMSTDGCEDIDYAPKTNPGAYSYLTSLSMNTGDMECDDQTFAFEAKTAVWVKDADSGVVTAVEAPSNDTCQFIFKPNAGIAGISFNEGDAGARTVEFALTLQYSTTQPVTINYRVSRASGDTASPGSDFVATSGAVTFQPIFAGRTGTSMFVPVTVYGDTTREGNETFTVALTGATNALIGPYKSARATILNDDRGSGLRASVSNAAIVEGNAVASVGGSNAAAFHITLSRPVPAGHAPIIVKYRVTGNTATGGSSPTPGADFQQVTTAVSLKFTPGQQDKRVLVRVFADPFIEPDETFSFNLTSISGGATITSGVGIGIIRNDD